MNIKFLITALLLVYSLISNCQEITEQTYRIQGYLIINSFEPISPSKKHEYIFQTDNPKIYCFTPLKSVSENVLAPFFSIKGQRKGEIFLPMGLTESEQHIMYTNSGIKLHTGIDIESFNRVLKENKLFHNIPKTVIKLKNDELENAIYEIVYIDGIWVKVSIPFKYSQVISIGRYSSSQLDHDKKDGYDYYFLKEIKVISYNPKFNDESVIQLE